MDKFNFENIYILRGSLTQEEVKKEIKKILKYFNRTEIYQEEKSINGFCGKKTLAYEIKKEKTGYYYITHFTSTYEQVARIENKLRLNDNVLKFITIRA